MGSHLCCLSKCSCSNPSVCSKNFRSIGILYLINDKIQIFLETLMQQALEKSAQVYLEILKKSHAETRTLVSDMHNFDEKTIAPLLGFPALASIIDRSIEDLYIPYLGENRYFNAEKAWLTENYELQLSDFRRALNMKGIKIGKSKNNDKTTESGSIAVSNLFSTVASTVNTMTLELNKLSSNPSNDMTPQQMLELEKHLNPNLEVATNCIKVTHLSFERAKELCRPADL